MFHFKYKLTLLIAGIILSLLAGIFWIVQHQIEQNAIAVIKENFTETRLLVLTLMADRQRRLEEIASGLAGSEFIRLILTDSTLDEPTRDDLMNGEILPDYPQLSLLAVVDTGDTILAINADGREIGEMLLEQPFYHDARDGKHGSGFVISAGRARQIIALPVTIGFDEEEEILGVLIVGLTWNEEDVEHIKTLTKADIAFINQQQIFLSSRITQLNGTLMPPDIIQQQLPSIFSFSENEARLIPFQQERFLVVNVVDTQKNSPPYLILTSLDRELIFVKAIRSILIEFAVGGVLIGLVLSFFFARGISKPITQLQQATTEIERGNLEYRVTIRSRDEFSQLGGAFNRMVEGLHEKERIRGVMNKVVSKEIADEILRSDLQLGGEERIATVLFSDIRGFTTFSELLPPKALLDVLNAYFTRVSECIYHHHGNIDKYIGDALMALFGVPIARESSVKDAVFAALDMTTALEEFNQTLTSSIGKQLNIGIGINTGKLVAGLMGASSRMEYTVMGDAVNLASRLEGLTKQYGAQIVISETTYQALQPLLSPQDGLAFRYLDAVRVKGKTRGVQIYQVLRQRPEIERFLHRFHQAHHLLESGHLQQAEQAFAALRQEWATDTVTALFCERVSAYLQTPPLFQEEYREGVYICTEK
ncbi:adenylate cyclase related protein [Candidatus Moduliflexus flocculans]|uniref:Adenylate cyclase related protein n=1 Tax=Candidatus Moduliflexus flocculans TaxID=1499966 RepID=A0A0S6VQ80_9BACT|nr:adenylate cyclase related protein [Candidatus Moduliflexus flocculans]